VPRVATSFELERHADAAGGRFAAFGPNDTGAGKSHGDLYGVRFLLEMETGQRHPGLSLRRVADEGPLPAFCRRGRSTGRVCPAETLRDYGFYTQLVYGFIPR